MRLTLKKLVDKCTLLIFSIALVACEKLIEVPPPTSSITTSEVFEREDHAIFAAANMYAKLIWTNASGFSSGGSTTYAGLSADELMYFNQTDNERQQFQTNSISIANSLNHTFWADIYSVIYSANSILEELKSNSNIRDSVKNELIGQAKFVRGFCYFYLVNFYGKVPLVLTTAYHKSAQLPLSGIAETYQLIINDFTDANNLLSTNFSVGKGQRIIPNKWAATAMLARVHLYLKNWEQAEAYATAVINNSTVFQLKENLNEVFLSNSTEAIWQLQQNNSGFIISKNATPEGYMFIPQGPTRPPLYYVTTELLQSFEISDKRKSHWLESKDYESTTYYYPYKYKMGAAEGIINGANTEYYVALRLSEQYLIRAEARANKYIDLTEAKADLNKIRNRAGLVNTTANTKQDLLDAVLSERKKELFAEWGHRWMDLKRTDKAVELIANIKNMLISEDALYFPIPVYDQKTAPNL